MSVRLLLKGPGRNLLYSLGLAYFESGLVGGQREQEGRKSFS